MLDFAAVRNRTKTLAELTEGLTMNDLHHLTDEMTDTMLKLILDAVDADVIFEPVDPQANDTYAIESTEIKLPWTLGHVIVHATASSEEAAAQACSLARSVPVSGRSRYEIPWQNMKTTAQLQRRLEESRRMRHAFLDAWPDEPDLELTYTPDYPGARPRNAIARFIAGLAHDDAHLGQIAEIMRQARAGRQIA